MLFYENSERKKISQLFIFEIVFLRVKINLPRMYRIIRPLLWTLEPELAHNLAIKLIKFGFLNFYKFDTPLNLEVSVGDLSFPSPVGLAAGFDKNAEIFYELFKIGFGFVEVGTITPVPQTGNPKPRIFRLEEDKGLINRLGFNNIGLLAATQNITKKIDLKRKQKLGVNIGPNKESKDRVRDYIDCLRKVDELADYIAINISSPNTPNLREFENTKIDDLLREIELNKLSKKPIFVKISPDLENKQIASIIESILKFNLDGLILTNTTTTRDSRLKSKFGTQEGGLSGLPLSELSNQKLSFAYNITNGAIPIIGVGGVFSGKDVYEKMKLGANLVQLYTSMVYEGPGLIKNINNEIEMLMNDDGIKNLSEIIGINHKA